MNKSTTKKSKTTSRTKKTSTAKTKTSRKKSTTTTGSGNDSLIIVESPTKARTLSKYLKVIEVTNEQSSGSGNGSQNSFIVVASGGHIRDLPRKRIGVDIDGGFIPEYELLPDKKKIAGDLKRAAKEAKNIYLATDPDREGEAIAWHISHVIGNKRSQKIWRVAFNEITKNAVRDALQNPGEIDMHKVDAQQARRVVDRLVGYQVSPLLWKTVTRGLSAGRVQSVALRMVCEREVEINQFIPEEYWSIEAIFSEQNIEPFKAKLHKLDKKRAEIPDEETSSQIVERIKTGNYKVDEIKKSRKKKNPVPPYTTSTLQQDSGRRLGIAVKRTMGIAQKLYEGVELGDKGSVGLITYMRTDSIRIADEANQNLRNWIAGEFGTEYVADNVRRFKNKKASKIQDAHEAIRPTDVKNTPKAVAKYLTPQELKVYELIWKRFVATQMKSAEIDVTTVTISDGSGIEFRTSGQVIVFKGYLAVYDDQANGKDKDPLDRIPKGLLQGMPLDLNDVLPRQHFTQPPPRYTEASLVKELDELGIGRPSTYATIISTLLDRKYIERKEKALPPTDLGITVNKLLVNQFPDIFNIEFTAKMEEDLDKIEEGSRWLDVVTEFYSPFASALQNANDNYKDLKKNLVAEPVGRDCPDCGGSLIYRFSRSGKFISCSNFPKCKYAESLNPVKTVESDKKCPKCGETMLLREGRFGKFYGCKNYPKCKGILPFTTGHKCPVEGCNGDLREGKNKRGSMFYGCTNYPKCRFAISDEPLSEACPQCKAPTIFLKKTKKSGDHKYCARKDCDYKEKVEQSGTDED